MRHSETSPFPNECWRAAAQPPTAQQVAVWAHRNHWKARNRRCPDRMSPQSKHDANTKSIASSVDARINAGPNESAWPCICVHISARSRDQPAISGRMPRQTARRSGVCSSSPSRTKEWARLSTSGHLTRKALELPNKHV